MKKTYYLFRHGITYWSKHKIPYGNNEDTAEILLEAKPVIERLGEYLKDQNITPDRALSSKYLRVLQTTAIVSEVAGIKFEIDTRLNEMRDENFETLTERIGGFIKWAEESEYNTFVLCTHGACLAALKHLLTMGEFHPGSLYDYPSSGVLQIIQGKEFKEIDFNY